MDCGICTLELGHVGMMWYDYANEDKISAVDQNGPCYTHRKSTE